MFGLFGKKEKKTKQINLEQVEVYIELYNGKVITKNIKGIYDEVFGCYSPAHQRLKYFMDKVNKENLLEIDKGYSINIRQEIKSVMVGDLKPLMITVDVD